MVNFWLESYDALFDLSNFKNLNAASVDTLVKFLNIISLMVLILSLILTIKTKNTFYFGSGIIILSIIIIIRYSNNTMKSNFGNVSGSSTDNTDTSTTNTGTTNVITRLDANLPTSFKNDIILLENVIDANPNKEYNKLVVNSLKNIYPGDVINITDIYTQTINQTTIVSNVYTTQDGKNIIILRTPLNYNFLKNQTSIVVLNSTKPQIMIPPDPVMSIQKANTTTTDLNQMLINKNNIFSDPNRQDYFTNNYQGPPYGNLQCRPPNISNPMGVIEIDDYNKPPIMYGTCNVDSEQVRSGMQNSFESGVSQRISDILYHKGNSQSRFTPMAVDTIPNAQEQFAFFCYQNPNNLVNPKYASVFVNDPEKFKMITSLAQATGTENGGGGGGGGKSSN